MVLVMFTSSNREEILINLEEGSKKGRWCTFDLEYVFDEKTGGLVKDLSRSER